MHRWLIAIFALHFVLNVSAFSLGEASSRAVERPTWIEATASGSVTTACHSTHSASPAERLLNHGLMDDMPDLPDTLSRTVVVLRQPVEPSCAIGYLAVRRAPLSLDTLLRPPQAPAL